MIVMEGLAKRGGQPCWMADECTISHAKALAAALAHLHARYWQSERLTQDLVWVRPRTKRFGWPWLKSSFSVAHGKILEKADELEMPSAAIELIHQWDQVATDVFTHWETRPHTVCHGDSHLGNTFSYPNGKAGLFDWQVMFRGSGIRDLSYFVHSAITNSQRIEHEAAIFDFYLETLKEGGVDLDRDDAWNDYCLYALDAWDAKMKTLSHGFYGHDPVALRRSLDCCIGSVLDHDVAGRLRTLIRSLRA